MATLNEYNRLVQAYRAFIEERSATVGAVVDGVSKAASALLGKIPVQVKAGLDALLHKAGAINSVGDMRRFDKAVEEFRGEMWRSVRDVEGLLENNKEYAYGRAKRTHQDALDALRQLNYKLDDFFHEISAPREAQELEQWLIDNNKW